MRNGAGGAAWESAVAGSLCASVRIALAAIACASALGACQAPPASQPAPAVAAAATSEADVEAVRAAEYARLSALVAADMDVAGRLHADDFQVINPLGRASSKEQYLAGVAAGVTDYLVWEADSMAVRAYGRAAALRYQSQVEMTVRGERRPRVRAWNTALYEKRGSEWQIVWFHVTELP